MPPSVEKPQVEELGKVEETEVPRIKDLIGSALVKFENVTSMDWKAQVVPKIDADHCINCGKC